MGMSVPQVCSRREAVVKDGRRVASSRLAERTPPPRHRFTLGESKAAANRCLDAALAWGRLLELLGVGLEHDG
jgi:hypothetical protein